MDGEIWETLCAKTKEGKVPWRAAHEGLTEVYAAEVNGQDFRLMISSVFS